MYNVYTYKSNLRGYILRRVFQAVIVFFVVSLVIFGIVNIGDKTVFLPSNTLPNEILGQLADKYHWDDSFLVEYVYWMKGIFTGDFGVSLNSSYPQ